MGTNTSSPCSNSAENACDITQCQTEISSFPEWNTRVSKSYRLYLKKNTKYQGKTVNSVIYSVLENTKNKQYIMQLCSFIKQVVDQGVCPFISPLYSIGYNCDHENNMVIIHGTPSGQPLQQCIDNENIPVHAKQLIVFQLLYVCYVLQLGHYNYGIHTVSLYVVTLPEPQTWSLATDFAHFQFTTPYYLRVTALPLFPPSSQPSELSDICAKVQIQLTDDIRISLQNLASQLNISSFVFPWKAKKENVFGVSKSFLKPSLSTVYQNLRSFSFEPRNEEVDMLVETLLQKQATVRRQMKEFDEMN